MNFTRTPNKILDQLSDMKKNELKLTMLLVRLTFGYMENGRHRESVRLTYQNMMDEMKVAKGTVNKAVQAVEKRGFFRRGRLSTWHLNPTYSLNLVQKLDQNGSEIEPKAESDEAETVQKLDQNGSEIEPNKLDNSSKIEPFQLDKEREREEKGEIGNPFPYQPPPKDDLPEHRSLADQRVEAILEVCGLDPAIPRHLSQAEHAAAQLKKYTAEDIYGRYRSATSVAGWNWYTDDWRGQRGDMPSPSQVVDHIAKQRTAAPPAHSDNGRHPSQTASERIRAQIAQMEESEHG